MRSLHLPTSQLLREVKLVSKQAYKTTQRLPMFESLENRALMSTTFVAAAGFSSTQNPNGPWAYGYSTAEISPLILYTATNTAEGIPEWTTPNSALNVPGVLYNPASTAIAFSTARFPAKQLVFDPGLNGEYSHIRFTAPAAANYSVAASFTGADVTGTSTDVHILSNGKSLFDGLVNGYGSASTVAKSFTLNNVAKGATIDFIVGWGNGNGHFDSTEVVASITQTIPPTSAISGLVFSDSNGNGRQDPNEPPLAGVNVYVDAKKTGSYVVGDPIAVTNASGRYTIAGLAAGTYVVRAQRPTGYVLTAPTAGDYSVSVVGGQTAMGIDFAEAPATSSIAGKVFNDVNGDGKLDGGELGLGGWTVSLSTGGKLLKSTLTDINGNFSFTGLIAGTYVVNAQQVTGTQPTQPANGMLTITITVGQMSSGHQFGEKAVA